jgi:hypothetical protein
MAGSRWLPAQRMGPVQGRPRRRHGYLRAPRRGRGHHGPLLRARRLIASGPAPTRRRTHPFLTHRENQPAGCGMCRVRAGRDHAGHLQGHRQNAERWLLLVFYVMLVGTMFIEVVRREVFSYSSIWGEEIVRYSFIYLAWIGAAAAVKRTRAYPHRRAHALRAADGEIAALHVRRHRDVRRRRDRALLVMGVGARVLEIRLGHPRPPDQP